MQLINNRKKIVYSILPKTAVVVVINVERKLNKKIREKSKAKTKRKKEITIVPTPPPATGE